MSHQQEHSSIGFCNVMLLYKVNVYYTLLVIFVKYNVCFMYGRSIFVSLLLILFLFR